MCCVLYYNYYYTLMILFFSYTVVVVLPLRLKEFLINGVKYYFREVELSLLLFNFEAAIHH